MAINDITPFQKSGGFLFYEVFINKLKYYEKSNKINRKRFVSYR